MMMPDTFAGLLFERDGLTELFIASSEEERTRLYEIVRSLVGPESAPTNFLVYMTTEQSTWLMFLLIFRLAPSTDSTDWSPALDRVTCFLPMGECYARPVHIDPNQN